MSSLSETKDYYAVYRPRAGSPTGRKKNVSYVFLCHVVARDQKHAMKITRDQGHRLPRGSYATRIGREGYYAALRQAFG